MRGIRELRGTLLLASLVVVGALLVPLPTRSADDRGLPPSPPGNSPWEIAEGVSEVFYGTALRSDTPEGYVWSGRVLVKQTFLGVHEPRTELVLHRDPDHPPIELTAPPSKRKSSVLYVLDEEDRLLLIDEHDAHRTASALGASRVPSERLTRRELRWGWFALDDHYAGKVALEHLDEEWKRGRLPLRLLELLLRCSGPEVKVEVLETLARGRPLTVDELDVVRISLCDLIPGVQAAAVHLLLDNGATVDLEPLHASLRWLRFHYHIEGQALLGAMVRLGDSDAYALLAELLEIHASPRSSLTARSELVLQAAWGDDSLHARVLPYLEAGTQNAATAWLRSGGSVEPVALSLRRTEGRGFHLKELAREGHPEAFGFAVGLLLASEEEHDADFWNAEACFLELFANLGEEQEEQREAFALELREILPERAKQREQLLEWLFRLGDPEALEEIAKLSSDGTRHVSERFGCAAAIAEKATPRSIEILVDFLVEAMTCEWLHDDTGAQDQAIARLACLLGELPREARSRAAAFFEERIADAKISGGPLVAIRWKLGIPPHPTEFGSVSHGWPWWGEFSLEGFDARYQAALPELRASVGGSCYALGLLKDEESIPAIGRQLAEDCRRYGNQRRCVEAFRLLGSPAATPYLYEALPITPAGIQDDIYRALGELEDPDDLARLAELSLDPDRTSSSYAKGALAIALGRE